jgi:hypothetical protein
MSNLLSELPVNVYNQSILKSRSNEKDTRNGTFEIDCLR